MRLVKMLAMWAVVVVSGCVTAGDPGKLETSVDDIYGTKVNALTKVYMARSDSQFLSETRIFASGDTALLVVASMNSCWYWLKCRSMVLVVDGEIIEEDDAEFDGDPSTNGLCYESLKMELDKSEVRRLRKATNIKVRACNATSVLTPPQVAQVRAAVAR